MTSADPMNPTTPVGPQPLTFTEAMIPVVGLVILIGLSFFLFGDAGAAGPNHIEWSTMRRLGEILGTGQIQIQYHALHFCRIEPAVIRAARVGKTVCAAWHPCIAIAVRIPEAQHRLDHIV